MGFGARMAPPPLLSDLGRPVEGALWMLATGLCFVGVTGIVRHVGTDLPTAQAAFLRFGFGVVFLAPTLRGVLQGGFAPGLLQMFCWRGVVHVAAVLCWFYAMARIPVAEVTAIGYLNPVLVTVGASLVFGERLAWRRIAAIGVALVGAAIVLRPGLRELGSGQASQLVASALFAGSYLFAKRLSGMASAGTVVAMLSLTAAVGLLPFALWVWVPASWVQLGWMAGTAVLGTAAHYCMTRAFAAAPLAVTQPVTFLQLVWATLLGVVAFGEPVDPYVLLGGAVIIGAISYITWREAVVVRRQVTPAAEATKG